MLYDTLEFGKQFIRTQIHKPQTNVLWLTMQTPALHVEYKIPAVNHSASGSFSVDIQFTSCDFCSMCQLIQNMGSVIIHFWLLV